MTPQRMSSLWLGTLIVVAMIPQRVWQRCQNHQDHVSRVGTQPTMDLPQEKTGSIRLPENRRGDCRAPAHAAARVVSAVQDGELDRLSIKIDGHRRTIWERLMEHKRWTTDWNLCDRDLCAERVDGADPQLRCRDCHRC